MPKALEVAVEQLDRKGVAVFAAAGNDGMADIVYPAKFPSVWAVGAQVPTSEGKAKSADWSNGKGTSGVRYWAAGTNVVSTTVDYQAPLTFRDDLDNTAIFQDLDPSFKSGVTLRGFACWDGTSFATPIVAADYAKRLLAGDDHDAALTTLDGVYGTEDNAEGFGAGIYAVDRCTEGTIAPAQTS